jgi:hypothetical protein
MDVDHLAARVHAALNEPSLDGFDREEVQRRVDEAVGDQLDLTVDDGGGLHDPAGVRIAAVRRTPSGEWIVEPQNADAHNARAPIPVPEPQNGR